MDPDACDASLKRDVTSASRVRTRAARLDRCDFLMLAFGWCVMGNSHLNRVIDEEILQVLA